MNTDTKSSRSNRRSAGLHSIVTLVLAGAILLMVNYLGFKYYAHRDLSQSQYYTLAPKTVDFLRRLDAPVTAYTFLDQRNPAETDEVNTLLKEYQRVGGKNFVIENIDPDYDKARAVELLKELHFDGNDHLVIFQYKAQTRFVKQEDLFEINPMTQQVGAFKGEQQFTAALISLVEGKAAKVYFTEGHGEHPIESVDSAEGYGALIETLKSDNIETAGINLATHSDVPADADAVVIAGPSVSFSPIEVQSLQKYLDGNGKLFILLDPYVTLGLDDLLKKYGLKFEDDMVLYRAATTTGAQITIPLAAIYQGGFSSHPITAKLAAANLQLLIQDARSITMLPDEKGQPNPKVQFLLQTDATAWGWINTAPNSTVDPKTLSYNKATDLAGPMTVAAVYDGGTTTDPTTKDTMPATRIIAVGASKFLQNDTAETVGANFFSNGLDWLVKKNAVLDINPKKPQDYGISLSPMQFRTVSWTALFFIPGAALLLGIFTWFSRRK